eukprot:gene5141-5225_t
MDSPTDSSMLLVGAHLHGDEGQFVTAATNALQEAVGENLKVDVLARNSDLPCGVQAWFNAWETDVLDPGDPTSNDIVTLASSAGKYTNRIFDTPAMVAIAGALHCDLHIVKMRGKCSDWRKLVISGDAMHVNPEGNPVLCISLLHVQQSGIPGGRAEGHWGALKWNHAEPGERTDDPAHRAHELLENSFKTRILATPCAAPGQVRALPLGDMQVPSGGHPTTTVTPYGGCTETATCAPRTSPAPVAPASDLPSLIASRSLPQPSPAKTLFNGPTVTAVTRATDDDDEELPAIPEPQNALKSTGNSPHCVTSSSSHAQAMHNSLVPALCTPIPADTPTPSCPPLAQLCGMASSLSATLPAVCPVPKAENDHESGQGNNEPVPWQVDLLYDQGSLEGKRNGGQELHDHPRYSQLGGLEKALARVLVKHRGTNDRARYGYPSGGQKASECGKLSLDFILRAHKMQPIPWEVLDVVCAWLTQHKGDFGIGQEDVPGNAAGWWSCEALARALQLHTNYELTLETLGVAGLGDLFADGRQPPPDNRLPHGFMVYRANTEGSLHWYAVVPPAPGGHTAGQWRILDSLAAPIF